VPNVSMPPGVSSPLTVSVPLETQPPPLKPVTVWSVPSRFTKAPEATSKAPADRTGCAPLVSHFARRYASTPIISGGVSARLKTITSATSPQHVAVKREPNVSGVSVVLGARVAVLLRKVSGPITVAEAVPLSIMKSYSSWTPFGRAVKVKSLPHV